MELLDEKGMGGDGMGWDGMGYDALVGRSGRRIDDFRSMLDAVLYSR